MRAAVVDVGSNSVRLLLMERLEPAYRRVMTDPKMVEQLEKQGYSMLYEDSATLGARIKRELAVVQEVFRKAGMKAGD